ncbi:MBOAT-domain-containing protein [Neoconidiobolus thromboides FSU 785]|nr:MBOAT-domain-containing protein [Neoconidiobolus thromboides FSU 785]
MVFSLLSNLIGVPQNVLRLLITVLLGYPIASIYKNKLILPIANISPSQQTELRNYYVTLTGLFLAILFNGLDIKHSFITISMTYGLCYGLGGILKNRKLAVVAVWLFNATYLLTGYYAHMGVDYDLTWTMPQCVLCLRMMGFGFDYYDGEEKKEKKEKKEKEISNQSKETQPETSVLEKKANTPVVPSMPKKKQPVSFSGETKLVELPKFSHFLGYSYFFSAFLVGPQFSFSLYQKFINNENLSLDHENQLPKGSESAAMKCFIKGIAYLALQQVLDLYFPAAYLLTEEYTQLNLIMRILVLWITGRGLINKYLGIWQLNEGACILSGISFNGYNQQGDAEWDGLTNIDTYAFETATSLDEIIACFNINTNFWIKQYVFKRLRFLNSKYLSQLGSLVFLSIWHGFHSGYMVTFILEFFDTFIEKKLQTQLKPWTTKLTEGSVSRKIVNFMCYLYTSFALLYAIIAFGLLRPSLYLHVYYQVYFIGHIGVILAFAVTVYLPYFVKSNKSEKKNQ